MLYGFRFLPGLMWHVWFGVLSYISLICVMDAEYYVLMWVMGLFVLAGAFGAGWDEPESLILAQSERWRHA